MSPTLSLVLSSVILERQLLSIQKRKHDFLETLCDIFCKFRCQPDWPQSRCDAFLIDGPDDLCTKKKWDVRCSSTDHAHESLCRNQSRFVPDEPVDYSHALRCGKPLLIGPLPLDSQWKSTLFFQHLLACSFIRGDRLTCSSDRSSAILNNSLLA